MSKQRPPRLDRPLSVVGQPTLPAPKSRKIGGKYTPYDGKTPSLKRPTVFNQMPDIFRAAFKPVASGEGPGAPPDGFLKATVSAVEWIVYFWLWILLSCDGDPRQGPFYGGRGPGGSFSYQLSFFGGRRSPGGAVPDFAILRPTRAVIIRLQGEWQHVFTHSVKIESELFQKGRLAGADFDVIDVYEQHILSDPYTRRGTVPRVLQDAIEGIAWLGPIAGGNPFRSRLPFS